MGDPSSTGIHVQFDIIWQPKTGSVQDEHSFIGSKMTIDYALV